VDNPVENARHAMTSRPLPPGKLGTFRIPKYRKLGEGFSLPSTTERIKVTESIPSFNGIRNERELLIWPHFPEN
jgi:hypothetical protein